MIVFSLLLPKSNPALACCRTVLKVLSNAVNFNHHSHPFLVVLWHINDGNIIEYEPVVKIVE